MADGHDAPRLSSSEIWARFRFSVIGPLLSSPPAAGALRQALQALAARTWRHPVTGKPKNFGMATIERWFYVAKGAPLDPVAELARAPRKDAGRFLVVNSKMAAILRQQYAVNPSWSYLLHFENLGASFRRTPELGSLPSYSTVRRFMKSHGLIRTKRRRRLEDGKIHDRREVRSFEVEHASALWHLDFHHGKKNVLTDEGRWVKPIAMAILDDFSRLVCHVQWYLAETSEVLVHAFSQAILRYGVPRALLTDNGSPMLAAEVIAGLQRLGIVHRTTLPYSPHQNGKQENWFGSLEGRLVAMLHNERDLSLRMLNDATAAWVHADYNRKVHQAFGKSPLERFLETPGVGRSSPSAEDLRAAFRQDVMRHVRRSDVTITIAGVRFELPQALATMRRIRARYATWDLGLVHLVDERTGNATHRIYPVDLAANSDGRRKPIKVTNPPEPDTANLTLPSCPPLLLELLENQARSGLPPAYIPKHDDQSSRPWNLDSELKETP